MRLRKNHIEEGLCNGLVKGNEALVYEVNSETDFVSKMNSF